MRKANNLTSLKESVYIDFALARGLDYYTGTIFEVKAEGVNMGSIGGGGRYDNLTGVFGMDGVSGVGISFGVERIYIIMEELDLFPSEIEMQTKVLFVPREESLQEFAFLQCQQLRNANFCAEIFLGNVKKQKHFKYAEEKNISHIVEIGENEEKSRIFRLRDVKLKEEIQNPENEDGFTIKEIINKLNENRP